MVKKKEQSQKPVWSPKALLHTLENQSYMMRSMLNFLSGIEIKDKNDARDFYKLLYSVANSDSSEANDIFELIIEKMSVKREGALTAFNKKVGKGVTLENLQVGLKDNKPINLMEIFNALKKLNLENKKEITANDVEKIKSIIKDTLRKVEESPQVLDAPDRKPKRSK